VEGDEARRKEIIEVRREGGRAGKKAGGGEGGSRGRSREAKCEYRPGGKGAGGRDESRNEERGEAWEAGSLGIAWERNCRESARKEAGAGVGRGGGGEGESRAEMMVVISGVQWGDGGRLWCRNDTELGVYGCR
jgi:hypothetical protein